ncbi:hydrogenase maturation protease, partial [Candidatus Kryptonium thompsonii]
MKGNREKNFLIVGVGNVFRGDDAVGILIARFLKRCFKENVKIIGVETSFDELIQFFGDYDLIIFIDAIKSGEKPGKIYRLKFGVDKIPAQLEFFSTHSVGLIEYI